MNQQTLPKLFSLTQIGIATFLGSALAAGYMLGANYSALGQRKLGRYVMAGSAALVALFMLIPGNALTSPGLALFVMIGQVMLVLFIANQLQGKMLSSFKEMGGTYYPISRTILIGIAASFVLTAAYILIIVLFGGPLPQTAG